MVKDRSVTDVKTKANIFNNFFTEQCPPLQNYSRLPINQVFLTESRLCFLDFNEDQILKTIGDLSIRKAHVHDDISIRMIKLCDNNSIK